jgi:hypothetical protein
MAMYREIGITDWPEQVEAELCQVGLGIRVTLGNPSPDYAVLHESAVSSAPLRPDHQWRRIPPGQLSIGSGSWRAAWLGNWLGWSLATKVAFGRLSDPTGRNASVA